jgi:hypothetical protein
VALAVFGAATGAAAQTTSIAPRVEVWGAVASRVDRFQRVESVSVVWSIAGINVFPTEDVGIQLLFDRTPGQVDLAGPVTNMSMAFNALVRLGPRGRAVTVSGGPAFFRLGGDVAMAGGTLRTFDIAHVIGANAGADVTVALDRHVALFAGCRYFGGPSAAVARTPASAGTDDVPRLQEVSGSRVFIALMFSP